MSNVSRMIALSKEEAQLSLQLLKVRNELNKLGVDYKGYHLGFCQFSIIGEDGSQTDYDLEGNEI